MRSDRVEIDAVLAAELALIAQQQAKRGVERAETAGLAVSGGGIRSTSFGLGVLQALDAKGAFRQLDYLSTVSGGGYIGSSLTWFVHQEASKGTFRKSSNPIAREPSVVESGAPPTPEQPHFPFRREAPPGREDRSASAFIRQHGDYLAPGDNLSTSSFAATVLRNALLHASVYFTLLVAAFYAIDAFELLPSANAVMLAGLPASERNSGLQLEAIVGAPLYDLLLGSVIAFAVVTAGYAVVSGFARGTAATYSARILTQKALGWVLSATALLAILASLPYLHALLCTLPEEAGAMPSALAGGAAVSAGFGGAMLEFLRQRLPPVIGKAPPAARIGISAFLLIYGLCFSAYLFVPTVRGWAVDVQLGALMGMAFLGLVVNVNHFGIGRMYRDRLMETFLPNRKAVEDGQWQPASEADRTRLSAVCHADSATSQSSNAGGAFAGGSVTAGPYHLINCNVVLVDARVAKHRGRGGDSFLLSPLFSGCSATGWYDTRHFVGDSMTLATAMSISGAAANPNTGVAGQGPTRNRLVSLLMGFFGLRLGYWAQNPAAPAFRRLFARLPPNLFYPGLLQGLFGQRLNAKAGFLDLSDGGHFENLGLYELARRRSSLILVSDGGADEQFTMGDLGNAIERIRVDFGYEVSFSDEARGLRSIMPGSSHVATARDRDREEASPEAFELAERGYALGTIDYGQGARGLVIYLKATLIAGLPGDLYAYKKAHPAFPHQSTADQFFDERQVEAYRELGYQLCRSMLEDEAVQRTWFGRAGASSPQERMSPSQSAETLIATG